MKMLECEDCHHIETFNDCETPTPCSQCNGRMGLPTTKTEPVAEVPCSAGLDALLEVVRAIRKSDCGAWLKDCNGIHRCSDGREKRQELMRLLDKLYKAASI